MPTTVKPALEIDSQELADTFGIQAIPHDELVPRDGVGRGRPFVDHGAQAEDVGGSDGDDQRPAGEGERPQTDRAHAVEAHVLDAVPQLRAAVRFLPEDEVPEDLVCSLERPSDAPDLTEAGARSCGSSTCPRRTTPPLTMPSTTACASTTRRASSSRSEPGVPSTTGGATLVATWRIWDDIPASLREAGDSELISPWRGHEPLRAPEHMAARLPSEQPIGRPRTSLVRLPAWATSSTRRPRTVWDTTGRKGRRSPDVVAAQSPSAPARRRQRRGAGGALGVVCVKAWTSDSDRRGLRRPTPTSPTVRLISHRPSGHTEEGQHTSARCRGEGGDALHRRARLAPQMPH